jgi:DNA-binding HxlR family transcriptional regulator
MAVIGEKYSILILREVFFGVRRFDALVRNIGAPRDILAARLRHLVEAGVLAKRLYQERPARYEYLLTPAGEDLRNILLLMAKWGDRHLATSPPVVFEHDCGQRLDTTVVCRHCGHEVEAGSLTAHVTAPGWTTTGPVTRAG